MRSNTVPPHSNYNEYDNQKCVPETVLERVFCENDDGNYDPLLRNVLRF